MHRALFSLDSIADREPGFACSCTDGALHAAWVHVAGEGVHTIVDASSSARRLGRRLVLLRGAPEIDRVIALTGSAGKLEIGDLGLDSGEPSGAAPQRSLVSSSLLRTGETARERASSH